ncbi:MAG TPA: sugar kinase [Bacillales bacterium]|nr:sugar kinase [Bacillales bacterium]
MISVIGDLVVDLSVRNEGIRYGTDTDGHIQLRAGGQGNHVAAWVARAGQPVRLIGRVGNDVLGSYLREEAERQGITCAVSADREAETGKIVILIDKETGERSMITDRGANLTLRGRHIVGIEESEMLYISGYTFFSEETREAARLAKECAIAADVPVAVDPSSVYFLENGLESFLSCLDGVTFIFPNYEEGSLLTGETEPERIIRGLGKFVPRPVLKLGASGCLLTEGNTVVEIPSHPVKAVDTTGAGDSFAGTFMAEMVRHGDARKAAEKAVKIASEVVGRVGSRPL